MAQTQALIEILKQSLKTNRLTYADIASRLDMSEANVKRMFAKRRFSLERLEEVCQLMQMEMSDLFVLYEASRQRIDHLTEKQEQELVGDEKLLLVAVSVRNQLSFGDIVEHYEISTTECIQCLAKLDRLKIIDLLPNNRIKLRIDEHFSWLPGGPIERFFEREIQRQFLKSRFKGDLEQRLFHFGLLGDASSQIMIEKMKSLAHEFTELHKQDFNLPLHKRHNQGLMLAMRPWQLEVFDPLIKN
ncbi:helix-turn-helix transcriptional regulator [candidate division KSB1 bacterium]|nr:helix-turn-helix transcriptional regulator [candidate division KSB1 bacterium]